MTVNGHAGTDRYDRVYRGRERWHFANGGSYACTSGNLSSLAAEMSPNEVAEAERCQRAGCIERWQPDHLPLQQPRVPEIVQRETEQDRLLQVVAGLVPATAQQLGAALALLGERLQELTEELADADEQSTRMTEAYQLAYDQEFLKTADGEEKVTGLIREARARVATAQLRLDTEVAKLRVRQLRNAHRTLDRRIDVGRTQAATIRSEHRTLSYGASA